MVPVIEAACPAALMAGLGRPHRAPPPEPATAGRAVRVPAVTGGTDREEAIALPTGLLTEGLVHGGDARRTTADWTSCPNRGTTRTTGSVCRRARRSRGPGGPSGPSSSLPLRYPKQPGSGHNGGYGRRRPRGRKQPRPPGLAKPRRPRFHTAPTAVIYSGKQEPRTARDPAGASTIVQICALSSERQQIGALPGFVVGDLMWKALWKFVENEQRFPRRGGRVLCVHGAVSFHRARPCARPVCRPGRHEGSLEAYRQNCGSIRISQPMFVDAMP